MAKRQCLAMVEGADYMRGLSLIEVEDDDGWSAAGVLGRGDYEGAHIARALIAPRREKNLNVQIGIEP